MAPTVILSPHLDDAVLSCWRVLTSPGEVDVVNVFAGEPAEGAARGWWDHHLGGPREALRIRIQEDERALAQAGRSARNLDFLDAQYRRGPQSHERLVEAIDAALPARAVVYAPAALGFHPDHDAVRAAALDLRTDGVDVVLYADLPHASLRGWPPWVTNDGDDRVGDTWNRSFARAGLTPESLEPSAVRLSDADFARKLEAVEEFACRVPAFEAMYRVPLAHRDWLGYEVVWTLPPAAPGSSSASAAARNPAAS